MLDENKPLTMAYHGEGHEACAEGSKTLHQSHLIKPPLICSVCFFPICSHEFPVFFHMFPMIFLSFPMVFLQRGMTSRQSQGSHSDTASGQISWLPA